MIQNKIKLITFLLMAASVYIVIATVGNLYAANYYAANNGSDRNPGSNTAPWATFSHAMNFLNPGDTLIIKEGTYNQPLRVTVSGTAKYYITIKAENDGKVILNAQGNFIPCAINNTKFIDVEGIIFKNSNDNVVEIGGSDHIVLRRVSAYYAANHKMAILGASSTNILIEDCVASNKPREGYIAIDFINCEHITIRRCFTLNTDPNIVLYETNNSIVENSIVTTPIAGASYGVRWGITVNATSYNRGNDNIFRVNIVLGNLKGQTFYGGFGITNRAEGKLEGNVFDNNVAINTATYYGLKMESDTRSAVTGNTFVMERTDLPAGTGGLIYVAPFKNNDQINAVVKNNSLVGNMNRHLSALAVQDSSNVIVTNVYNNYYNSTSNYGGNAHQGLGEKNANPLYRTGIYGKGAYLMIPAGLKGKGQAGADIGANVLYRYKDGVLSNAHLWPWAMEDRIKNELGISVTWESQGGLWKTLDSVYSTKK